MDESAGANNAAPDQTCPSIILSPEGDVLAELDTGAVQVGEAALDLARVSNWVLDQARIDLIPVTSREVTGG